MYLRLMYTHTRTNKSAIECSQIVLFSWISQILWSLNDLPLNVLRGRQ
ncbi:unnamed protein product [Callosobruchus maculatus]|uniref:Uncharacterized protein n=1 Tax=Callosobruchus maculatus TaxID=64391 RepID=A0A653DA72_CALMS|nr:unnamed protein product [Callosobruchus maculatus]